MEKNKRSKGKNIKGSIFKSKICKYNEISEDLSIEYEEISENSSFEL